MINKSMEFWENSWDNENIDELKGYLKGYYKYQNDLIKLLKTHNVIEVCDAACGFGAYSLLLASNGMKTSGFDFAKNSVELTKQLLHEYGVDTSNYIVCSITNIKFDNESFDATIAHAVLDHLSVQDAKVALEELYRITKNSGLIYITFDGYELEDEEEPHETMDDGCFLYTDGIYRGMIFKFYQDDDIKELCKNKKIIYQQTNTKGERVLVLQKVIE